MTGQMITVGVLAWVSGALTAGAFLYPLGRRHGIEALAQHWRGALIDDEVEKIARKAGAKVRRRTTTKA